jgi:hypothetical protein
VMNYWEDEPGDGNFLVHSQQTSAKMHILSSVFLSVHPCTHPSVHLNFDNGEEHFTKIS